MGLLIRQGVHKDEKPLESDYELAQITKLREVTDSSDKVIDGVMSVELTILTEGALKGKKLFDRVPYDPEDKMAWKYKALRRHAGCPYDKTEAEEIDIEELLLKKAVGVSLSIYEHADGRLFQNVTYLAVETDKASGAKTGAPTAGAIGTKPAVDLDDLDDLDVAKPAPKKEATPATEATVEVSATPIPKKDTPAIEVSDDDFPF